MEWEEGLGGGVMYSGHQHAWLENGVSRIDQASTKHKALLLVVQTSAFEQHR